MGKKKTGANLSIEDRHANTPIGKLRAMMHGGSELPMVSVVTVTYNRRPFIPFMRRCFDHQTYPKDRMEWIVVDDGSDSIEDLIIDHPCVKYFRYDEKIPLGKKRNVSHSKCAGDILVYMDDDDYYPPCRVEHAVTTLMNNPDAKCVGSSKMYMYFKSLNEVYAAGPYGPDRATAATLAFRRTMLDSARYDDDASISEETAFLGTHQVVQMDSEKTILVLCHNQNTVDKHDMLTRQTRRDVELEKMVATHSPAERRKILAEPKMMVKSSKSLSYFVRDPSIRKIILDDLSDDKLALYSMGSRSNKPDAMQRISDRTEDHAHKVAMAAEECTVANMNALKTNYNRLCKQYMLMEDKLKLLEQTCAEKDRTIAKLIACAGI